MIDYSKYSCDKCKREGSWFCKRCWHTAGKKPTRFKPKKKTGCETPEYRRKTLPPNPNLGWQPQYTPTQNPPAPPTSGSNAVKPNPNYIPPASVDKPKQTTIEDTHHVQLYCTIDDLNAYIHKHLEGKGKYTENIYVPIGATVNPLNLNVEVELVAINPTDSDYGRRVRLEVKL